MAEVEIPQELTKSPNSFIASFLLDNVPEYCRLVELRQKGWASSRGDKFFAIQRRNADFATAKTAKYFYVMMKRIAQDMNSATQVLQIDDHQSGTPHVLDFCAAPGGFLTKVMQLNPSARAQAFSLPKSDGYGGHQMLMPESAHVNVEFLDITMLAADMDVAEIPIDHADAKNFIGKRFQAEWKFDLILCDGHVLRGHNRAEYRERCEARRLTAVQLALGLRHVGQGGSMVILLHKLDEWATVATIFRFSKFSSVRLFKPRRDHATRSSFYLVATNIDRDHVEAEVARNLFKDIWTSATFGDNGHISTPSITHGLDVNDVLVEFGQDLVKLGRTVLSIQADALAQAPYTQD